MQKHDYRIRYYCGTDLRGEHIVEAVDDRAALIISMDRLNVAGWCISPEFRIEIARAR